MQYRVIRVLCCHIPYPLVLNRIIDEDIHEIL